MFSKTNKQNPRMERKNFRPKKLPKKMSTETDNGISSYVKAYVAFEVCILFAVVVFICTFAARKR